MNKRKLFQWCKRYVIADNVRIVLLLIPLTYLFIKLCVSGQFSWDNYLDTSVLVSFILVFFCEGIAKLLSFLIGRHCEDATKLTEDYDKLCKKYSRENGFVLLGEKKCPVICLCLRKQKDAAYSFLIKESEEGKRYELPTQVAEKADIIMGAHGYSNVYNNRNIRLDGLSLNKERNELTLSYSTTMYFDSLVTNRAMDYDWGNGKTVREVYEPGPFLSTLKESKLSNHLGFNGFVETADGQIIFVMRYGKVSIGKCTLGDSIGASLKTAYCLDDERKFNQEGLEKAIRGEIKDELKIPVEDDVDLCKGIFAFYRDVVEGGKPQFLFYYQTKLSADEVEKKFKDEVKEDKKKKRGTFLTDGKKLIFIPREELGELVLAPGSLERKSGKRYRMMPSAVASVQMLKEFLGV